MGEQQLKYCRLCLKPEDTNEENMRFVQNLCFCQEGNFHRRCLDEWITYSGYSSCKKCHCPYNLRYEPQSLLTYLWSSPSEWVRFSQKLVRLADIVHITMLTFYVCFYLELNFFPLKLTLITFTTFRAILNLKALRNWLRSILSNYSEWKRRHFRFILLN